MSKCECGYCNGVEHDFPDYPTCPECGKPLYHFGGLDYTPDFLYCPDCLDVAYDLDGTPIFKLT